MNDGYSHEGGRWLPDPTGRYEFRWFNGQDWTADVAVQGHRFVDPAGARMGPPVVAGPLPPHSTPGLRPPGPGMGVAAFVVGLCSFLFGFIPFIVVLAFAGAVTGLILGIGALRRKVDGVVPGKGLATAGVVLSSLAFGTCALGVYLTVQVVHTLQDLRDPGPHEAVLTRCDHTGRLVDVRGTVTNLDEVTNSYVVTVEITADGDVLATLDAKVNNVSPGATETFSTSEFVDADVDVACRIAEVRGPSLLSPP
ncbi:MAG: DUF4190 domain-containing protein [Ilumatobacteraceae bacterium]